MENKNITTNLLLKQINQSNAIAYNNDYLAESSDYNFKILEVAYANTAKMYAAIKMDIKNNNCTTGNCYYENQKIKQLEEAPQVSINFIQNILGELAVTDTPNYDVNNDYRYLVANSIFTSKPGFSKTDGYKLDLFLNDDGTQTMVFDGPMFEKELVINSAALESILEADTFLVTPTPDIQAEMVQLLGKVGIFNLEDVLENGQLAPNARISEEFIMKNSDGSFDYEIIEHREGDLVKLGILVNGEPVDALAMMIHKDFAQKTGREVCEKLKDLIPRHNFMIPVQAAIGGKIIARETIKGFKKDVLTKIHGGGATDRKRKLLEKQKKGKARSKQFGRVEIPQEAFIGVLKISKEK